METKFNPVQEHFNLCDYIHNKLYIPKNNEYGDSFHKMYQELGIISAATQISHKYNRFVNLAKHKDSNIIIENESLEDTLLDLANYCILTVMELKRDELSKHDNASKQICTTAEDANKMVNEINEKESLKDYKF